MTNPNLNLDPLLKPQALTLTQLWQGGLYWRLPPIFISLNIILLVRGEQQIDFVHTNKRQFDVKEEGGFLKNIENVPLLYKLIFIFYVQYKKFSKITVAHIFLYKFISS